MLASALSWVHKFLCPTPLSPLFQSGGALEMLNEDVTLTVAGMGFLFVVDNLIVKRFIKPKARYFALHVVANAVTAVAAFPDVVRGITGDPRTAFSGPSHTMVANSMVAAIHLYHCVAFPLRREDIVHHLTFVSILCGLAIPLKQVDGIGNNFGCFFLSGVPGGIIYANLVAVAHGLMDKMTEKKLAATINVWLRGPSMVVYAFLGWASFINGNVTTGPLALLICVLLHFTNGQYYSQQAVESYATHKERERVAKEAGKSEKEKKDE